MSPRGLSGVDLGTAMEHVKARLAGLALPAGVTLEYGGLYAEQQKAFQQLTMVLVAGTVMMFLVLVWEFGRITPGARSRCSARYRAWRAASSRSISPASR